MDNTNATANVTLSEEDALDAAYDIFLELAPDNLSPADILLFNLQFEESGAAEVVDISAEFWNHYINFTIDDNEFCEVIIGLVDEQDNISDIFARVLISRNTTNKFCHIIWKED